MSAIVSFSRIGFLATFLIGITGRPAVAQDMRLAPEDFAILPWGWTPGDEKVLNEIRECGFNMAGFVAPEHVELVAKAGLKCLVSDHTITSGVVDSKLDDAEIARRVKAAVEGAGRSPAVLGYYLRDEPGAAMYPQLARWTAAFQAAAPSLWCYINLFPVYVSKEGMNVATYDEYVETFVASVRPKFISYDNYSLMDDGSLRDGYFQNLEIVRAKALKYNLPFWNIVLSNAHFHYARPNDATFHFQAYTTLAYGARGISYFTYFTPSLGNYRLGPIDQFGNKTATWDALRRVNLQIHRLGPTYVKLKSVNVFHHPNVPTGSAGVSTSRHLTNISGGDFLVGEFEDAAGRPYCLVVNKSLAKSCTADVKFKSPGAVQVVNAYTATSQPWTGEHVWFAPGQGQLLTVQPQ